MRKRILFVTYTKYFGGAEKHLIDLIRRLDLCTVEPFVLCFGMDFFTQGLNRDHGLNIEVSSGHLPGHLFAYWSALGRFHPYAVVFINAYTGFFPWYAYLAGRLSGARRVFAIEQILGSPAPPKCNATGVSAWLRKLIGWRSRYMLTMKLTGFLANRIICVSESIRERLTNEYGYPKDRTVTVWNGVDLRRYCRTSTRGPITRESLGIGDHEIILVCVARLIGQKRIDILLDAMAILAKEHWPCRCIIVGEGPFEDKLRKMATDLGLGSSVLFMGFKEDVRPYLEIADMFVLSSRVEGLSLALGEAMAYGLPCVATDAGGNGEIVLHGETGLIVRAESAEELAEAIGYAIAHEDERRRMGAAARKRVEEYFNIDDTMARIQSVLLA